MPRRQRQKGQTTFSGSAVENICHGDMNLAGKIMGIRAFCDIFELSGSGSDDGSESEL